ncbi:type VI secretion system baseplate subunit TssF [Klebsiella pneumoniae]|nr:type VI secretion system baseplate subunit TssF [Klebsiella pneumoniae]
MADPTPGRAVPASAGSDRAGKPRRLFFPGGFSEEDRLWPKGSAFSGYQLLLEYFTFREKFMFVQLNGLENITLLKRGYRISRLRWCSARSGKVIYPSAQAAYACTVCR